jgi:NitT/TauT family transport system substrate-binding protein
MGRVRVAVGGQSVLYHLPLALADLLGYFKSEGLDVVVSDFAGGAMALQAVLQGAADVGSGAYEYTIRQQVRGIGLRAMAVHGRAPQIAMGVSRRALPGYQGLDDLAGRRIGVSALGSSTHLMARHLLRRAGLKDGDVTFVGVGSGPAAVAELRTGRVHALCHADPIMTLLEQKMDVHIVGDLRTLRGSMEVFGGNMPAGCLYAPQAFVQKHPEQVQALTNAIVHALKWLQTAAPADLIKVVPPGYLLGDRGLYLAAFSRVRDTFSPNGLMPEDGPATALRVLARMGPEVADVKVDLARTFSNEWVRKARQKYNV